LQLSEENRTRRWRIGMAVRPATTTTSINGGGSRGQSGAGRWRQDKIPRINLPRLHPQPHAATSTSTDPPPHPTLLRAASCIGREEGPWIGDRSIAIAARRGDTVPARPAIALRSTPRLCLFCLAVYAGPIQCRSLSNRP
jgi:hypothetical protein